MTKKWNRSELLVSILLLVMLVSLATPVAATTLRIDLNQTYQFNATSLSRIATFDLWDPSASKVEMQTTTGDNSDVQVIQQPNIRTITRVFNTTSESFEGNTVTVVGDQSSTINNNLPPVYRYYVMPEVPTFKVTGPPGSTGNAVAVRFNESAANAGTLLNSAGVTYLYNGTGILQIKSPGFHYSGWATFDTVSNGQAPLNQSDVNYTLFNNRVSISPYTGNAVAASDMGQTSPNTLTKPGKYFAGAISHNNGNQTATVEALTPFVVLNETTPISWTDDYGAHQLPMTYVKGAMGNVTLTFSSTDPFGPPTHIGYLFVNSTAQYGMQVNVNTSLLVQNVGNQWQTVSPPTNVIEMEYEGILNQGSSPFTYTMTASGQANPPVTTQFSTFAITPGYGISDKKHASSITIPAGAFSDLNDGVYYLYLMGTDDNNNVVALSQSTVYVKSGAVPEPSSTTITGFAPATGYRNTTVSFTLTGTNFPTAFGTSGVNVNLTKALNTTITTNITSVSSTTITGTFNTNRSVDGGWDAVLTTNDAGQTIKTSAFTINSLAPVVSTVVPVSAYQNNTIYFTITGSNFQTASSLTTVNFTQGTSYFDRNVTINSVTTTSINGTLFLNKTAPFGAWNLSVKTADGGPSNTLSKIFTVKNLTVPVITAVVPVSAYQNSTIYFTITGSNFATGSNMNHVNFTQGSYFDRNATINSMTATSINGTLFLNKTAPAGAWNLSVTTTDGTISNTMVNSFTVKTLIVPVVTTVVPVSAYQNSTIYFTITGSNFPTGSGMTHVNFTQGTYFDRNATINSITATSINGTLFLNKTAPAGAWNLSVTTTDGTISNTMVNPFTVKTVIVPIVTTVVPVSAYQNSTIYFTITGSNFPTGSGMTHVNFTQGTYFDRNATINSITATSINGTLFLNKTAPFGAWNLSVTNTDGTISNTLPKIFTVKNLTVPVITAVVPVSAYQNSTIYFTITGSNFATGSNMNHVNFTQGSYFDRNATINSITATSINGTLFLNKTAPAGAWNLSVTTTDGTISNTMVNPFTVKTVIVPIVTTVVPVSAYQNSTIYFTITGSNFPTGSGMTHVNFTQGTYFDRNATINSITATSINGTLFLNKTAPFGAWNLSVTNTDGTISNTLPKIFTVKNLTVPVITAVVPVSAYQNSTIYFTITGSNFATGSNMNHVNFTQGSYFDRNATINSMTATSINGTLFLNKTAPAGAWNLSVTTTDGTISNTMVNPFTVKTVIVPIVTTVVPVSAYQNSTIYFTITGSNFPTGSGMTHVNFTQGTYFDRNATINSITATSINGTLFLNKTAPAGAWNLSVTTTDGTISNTMVNPFTVKTVIVPVITTVVPVSAYQNSTIYFTITGSNFATGSNMNHVNFTQGSYFDRNATINSMTATSINGTLFLNQTAPSGAWNLSVTTTDGTISNTLKIFTVKPLVPAITAVVPGSSYQNRTIYFTITGSNFPTGSAMTHVNFTQGTYFDRNATINSITATSINGTLFINTTPPFGKWNLSLTTTDGSISNTLLNTFSMTPYPAPTLGLMTPASGYKNTTVSFTINGNNFQTAGGATNVSFVNEYSGNTLYGATSSVTGSTITGTLLVPATADGGVFDLLVTTVDGGSTTSPGVFTVNYLPLPTITTINQTSGYKNTTVTFLITGNNFQPGGGTFVRINSTAGAPILASLNSVTSTNIVGNFSIPYNAGSGLYRLDILTQSGGSSSKLNAFTVKPFPAPVINTISPPSSFNNRTFIITATGANFEPTATFVYLTHPTGNVNITVSLINVTPTQLNGTVIIPAGAPTTALWKLNVTTLDGGVTTKTPAITINNYPVPTFTSITPNIVYRNTTVSFTVAGTNFQDGGTNLTFWNKTNNKVLNATIFSVTPTQIIGSVVTTTALEPGQIWYANITTVDGGPVAKDSAFTVLPMPKPVISSIAPVSGPAGTAVPFTITGSSFQTRKGTNVTFVNGTSSILATVNAIYTTRITGTATIPPGATTGPWALNVTTVDAGSTVKNNSFTVF